MAVRKSEKSNTVITLTIEDAMQRHGLSRSRLYVLLGEGKVAAIKVGRRTLVKVASLDAYMANLPAPAFTISARRR